MLPPGPSGRRKRTLARLYTLVGRTAGRASATLELGEELVALHETYLALKPPGAPRRGEERKTSASLDFHGPELT